MRPRQPPLASAHWAQRCWIRSSAFVVTEIRTRGFAVATTLTKGRTVHGFEAAGLTDRA